MEIKFTESHSKIFNAASAASIRKPIITLLGIVIIINIYSFYLLVNNIIYLYRYITI